MLFEVGHALDNIGYLFRINANNYETVPCIS